MHAVDEYRQAKQAAARAVLEAKTWVWEEFIEAMEEDYRSASKKFCQTVLAPQNGGSSALPTLFTVWANIFGRWKEYFEDLLNPTLAFH
ncbi:hypothetical protein L3Q82_006324 [Scortum barcoo]|uniref:Uncharacterized protein n=1 Tax=Scortum barcoo TaxID=214431 RepID=A0ACB8X333_9TELE|nr:hypothetical protein L3Q82_006324 [Scortum barcoo]